jgi:hypothetical protein
MVARRLDTVKTSGELLGDQVGHGLHSDSGSGSKESPPHGGCHHSGVPAPVGDSRLLGGKTFVNSKDTCRRAVDRGMVAIAEPTRRVPPRAAKVHTLSFVTRGSLCLECCPQAMSSSESKFHCERGMLHGLNPSLDTSTWLCLFDEEVVRSQVKASSQGFQKR